MKRKLPVKPSVPLERRIISVRGEKVILDLDLAEMYGVTTKGLNQAVKRNAERFPTDFAFFLNDTEKTEVVTNCDHLARLKFSPVPPRAFTEHGAIMVATVLNSPQAVQMSLFVVRAFVRMRTAFKESADLAQKLRSLEHEIKIRQNIQEAAIVDVLQRIMKLLDPPPPPLEPPQPEIGFHVKEDGVPYRVNRKSVRR